MRIIAFLLALFILPVPLDAHAQTTLNVSAEACVLMHEDGRIIYEKNADSKMLIASTTKLMTAIVTLENAKLSSKVKIKAAHCNIEGSSMYLKAGEVYTVEQLLLGLMLASGNDAAVALAEHVAGDIKSFAKLMNQKAEELGMDNTSFSNPHGLDQRGHYSCARDMAKLMLYCMENDAFKKIVGCYSTDINGKSFVNHNRLLKDYPGCIGGKTGFTSAAGRCLVSCCEKNGMRFVCVTLSAPDDWRDHAKLYDLAYATYIKRDLTESAIYQVPVLSGNKKSVSVAPADKLEIFSHVDDEIKLRAEIPVFIFAPVKIGDTAGKICVIIKNNVVAEMPLVYTEEAVMAYPCLNTGTMEVFSYGRENTEADICLGAYVQKSSGTGLV